MTLNIPTQVKEIIADKMGLETSEIAESASIKEDLGADSLAEIEIVMGREDQFDLDIPDEVADKIQTVSQAIACVEELCGSN